MTLQTSLEKSSKRKCLFFVILFSSTISCSQHEEEKPVHLERAKCLHQQKNLLFAFFEFSDERREKRETFEMSKMLEKVKRENASFFVCPICKERYKINPLTKFWENPLVFFDPSKEGEVEIAIYCPCKATHGAFLAINYTSQTVILEKEPLFIKPKSKKE